LKEKSETPAKPLVVSEREKDVPVLPDQYTKKDSIYFDGGAPNQVFKFERWGLSYGTDDKGHAAAIILSVLIVCLLALIFIGGLFVERAWIADALKFLGTAFTFVAGVAIGKSSNKK